MSARDSASPAGPGNSGAGGLGNGGLGGGMGGGLGGGGWGGGMSGNTGLGTGNNIYGTSAWGRPGGMAMGYGMSPNQAFNNGMQPRNDYGLGPIMSHPAIQGIISQVLTRPAVPAPATSVPLTKANLPAFFGGPRKTITDRVPQDPNFPGNTFNQYNGAVGYGPGWNGYGR